MKFDIAVVGASTAGSYFARRMSEKGFSVLVIDSTTFEKISPVYDIFHISMEEMEKFRLPYPEEDDPVRAFYYKPSAQYSAYGHYPKPCIDNNIGLHKRGYIQKMIRWAEESGARFEFEASFEEVTYGENGKVNGLVYSKNGEQFTVEARLVADCSGIPAVVRRSLPDGYGMEKFELKSEDFFYVTLYYVRFKEQLPPYLESKFWLSYKSWLSPSGEENGAILGTGAAESYQNCENARELLLKNVELPEFEVTRKEQGVTPYHREIYSFVADGFIALGDAASLTKPLNGEGCTANMVLADIAASNLEKTMKDGAYPTREKMWEINKIYVDKQGKEFSLLRAALVNIIKHSLKSNEYMFEKDCIMSSKIIAGDSLNIIDIFKTLWYIIVGLVTKNLKCSEIRSIFGGAVKGIGMMIHYQRFPKTEKGFDKWAAKSEKLWSRVGSICEWDITKHIQ